MRLLTKKMAHETADNGYKAQLLDRNAELNEIEFRTRERGGWGVLLVLERVSNVGVSRMAMIIGIA
jgi:hypothetical protein